jgi:hypothetical protein
MRHRTRSSWTLLVVAVALCAAAPRPAIAASIGLDFTPGPGGFKYCSTDFHDGCVAGWEFTVASPVSVISLGVWDEGANGLVESHPVGLWTSGGALLATATVTNASTPVASTGPGQWMFTPIAPLVLAPGSYVIGAWYSVNNSGDALRFNTAATTIPQITYNTTIVQLNVPALTFPTMIFSNLDPGLYGPDFQVASAPEPASLVLLATGLGLFVARRRSRG